jgi:serine/threonine-protein kinase HipA
LLSPAYDLLNVAIANPDDQEEMALTLEGKKKKLIREYFERFGNGLGLIDKQVENVFKRFIENKITALEWIDNSFLSDEYKEKYKALLEERYSLL